MKRSPAALLLLAAWTASLAALGLFIERRLDIGSDLRLFLPAPKTTEQRLLLDAIGEGPASRLLVVTLENASPEELAATSSALAESLRGNEQFRFVANGELGVDSLPEELLPYRYLLAADDSARAFDRSRLREALEARARDLALPGGFASGAADRARSDLADCSRCSSNGNPLPSRASSSTSGSTRRGHARYSWPKHVLPLSIRRDNARRWRRSTKRSPPRALSRA